jgi:hypothetical protein
VSITVHVGEGAHARVGSRGEVDVRMGRATRKQREGRLVADHQGEPAVEHVAHGPVARREPGLVRRLAGETAGSVALDHVERRRGPAVGPAAVVGDRVDHGGCSGAEICDLGPR